MKKYFVLTSVLALTACAGGSGGNGAVSGGLTPAQRAAVESNKNITGMLTYLETDGSGNTINSRAATTRNSGLRQTAGAHDLSDVDFNLADEGFGGVVRFNVDTNKKITSFSVLDDERELVSINGRLAYAEKDIGDVYIDEETGEIATYNSNATVESLDDGTYRYTSEDGDLNGLFIINGEKIVQLYEGDESSTRMLDGKLYPSMNFTRTNDESYEFDGRINAEGGEVDATLTYNSIGKTIGLKYSDFGYFQIASDEDVDRPVSLIGGYESKQITNKEDLPTTETAFSGKAYGSVIALRNNATGQELDIADDDATLQFSKGTSKLTASFTNWYDVKYTETYGDSSTKSVNYSNYKNNDNTFRMLSDTHDEEENTWASGGEGGFTMGVVSNTENGETFDSINSDIRQYGDNGIVSEMVGLVQVRDCANGVCGGVDIPDYDEHNNQIGSQHVRSDEVRMNLSFGGKAE